MAKNAERADDAGLGYPSKLLENTILNGYGSVFGKRKAKYIVD